MPEQETHSRAKSWNEEVRVYQTSIDKRMLTGSALLQPSFFMGLANMLILVLTQRFPEEFMLRKYLTMSYKGVRTKSMLTIPFCLISGSYFAVASILCNASSPLAGHLVGCCLSFGIGASMLSLHRVSWYYPALALMYFSFGGFHHYRRMMMYGDNAPVFYWSDFSEIWRARHGNRALSPNVMHIRVKVSEP